MAVKTVGIFLREKGPDILMQPVRRRKISRLSRRQLDPVADPDSNLFGDVFNHGSHGGGVSVAGNGDDLMPLNPDADSAGSNWSDEPMNRE
jgi:hypothetical protein